MKRILILCRTFPPLNVVASSRPLSWANHFASQGHQVTVITTEQHEWCGPLNYHPEINPAIKVIEVPWPWGEKAGTNKYIRKFSRTLLAFPMLEKASELFSESPFDVVISTFEPAAAHFAAGLLKRKYPNVFWLADYRDTWSNNYLERGKKEFRKFWARQVETWLMKVVDLQTTVSDGMVLELEKLFGKERPPKRVVFNGFEGSYFEPEPPSPRIEGPLRFIHTGTVYRLRNPKPLFQALKILEKKGYGSDHIQLDFYGHDLYELQDIVKEEVVEKFVSIPGSISRSESLKKQKEADFLLFLDWDDPEVRGVLTGKIFEYIQSNTPVLSVGPADSDAVDILKSSQTGYSFGKDPQAIADFLEEQIKAPSQLPSWFQPNKDEINQFHRKEQAKVLENVLNEFGAI